MIFSNESINAILAGKKTMTRRLVKEGESGYDMTTGDIYGSWGLIETRGKMVLESYVQTENKKLKWQVGKEYSVQSGRGKPCVLYSKKTKQISYPLIIKIKDKKNFIKDWNKLMKETKMYPLITSDKIDWIVPLRIRITSIRQEHLNSISDEDAIKEGFKNKWDFLWTFCEINKKEFKKGLDETCKMENTEPHWNPLVWVLSFEVIK